MLSLLKHLTLAFAALILPLSGASAKNVTADITEVAQALQKAGYKAAIREEDGEPFIESSTGGMKFLVLLYGCDDKFENCKSVQFYSGFAVDKSPTLEAMNSYAAQNRFGRVYIDEDGDPAIEMDVDLEMGGMSEELFIDNIAYWDAVMLGFASWVYENEETESSGGAD